eukprot:4955096-Pyramimonas_sp.AAC.1
MCYLSGDSGNCLSTMPTLIASERVSSDADSCRLISLSKASRRVIISPMKSQASSVINCPAYLLAACGSKRRCNCRRASACPHSELRRAPGSCTSG